MTKKKLNFEKVFLRFTSYIVVGLLITFILQNTLENGLEFKNYKFSFDDLIQNYTYLLFSVICSYVIDVLSKKFKKSTK